MAQKAARIPEAEWETHKQTIRSLYLDDNLKLKGSGGLIEVMTNYHGFSASEAQYERHLKKWGFSKNQKKDVWEVLSRKVEKRKREGKESEVYLDNQLVKTAKRQLVRYKPTETLYGKVLEPHQAPTPKTPEGFSISTPKQEPLVQTFSSWGYNLPFYKLESEIISYVKLEEFSSFERALVLQMENSFMMFHGGSMQESKLLNSLKSLKRSMLPNNAIRDSEMGTCSSLISEEIDQRHMILKILIFSMANNTVDFTENPEEILSLLKNAKNQQLFKSFLNSKGPGAEALVENLFKVAVMAGNSNLVDILLQRHNLNLNTIFIMFGGHQFTPLEYSSIFRNVEVVKLLIQAGADVNMTVMNDSSVYEVSIGVLDRFCEMDIGLGALGVMFGSFSRLRECDRIEDLAITGMLLDAGAEVDSCTLELALEYGDLELIQLLLNSSDETDYSLWTAEGIVLPSAIQFLNQNDATKFIKNIVQPAIVALCSTDPTISYELSEALNCASKAGNLELVEFFLVAGAKITEKSLLFSIDSKSLELTKCLIKHGADPDPFPTPFRPEELIKNVTPFRSEEPIKNVTPFSLAIMNKDQSILKILIEAGVLSGLKERRRFFAALWAASNVGHHGMLQFLLNTDPDSFSKDLGELLMTEKYFQKAKIVKILIRYGVKLKDNNSDLVQQLMFEFAHASSPQEIELVQSIFDGHLSFNHYSTEPIWSFIPAIIIAAEQGNLEEIRRLVALGVDVNEVFATGYGNISFPEDYEGPGCRDGCCESALTISIRKKYSYQTRFLLHSGADVNNNGLKLRSGATALARATQRDAELFFEELIFHGADPNDTGTLLQLTTSRRNMTLLDKLLEAYTRVYPHGVKNFGSFCLARAIEHNDSQVIQKLLAVPVDINSLIGINSLDPKDFISPLGASIYSVNLELVQRLLDAGGDPNGIVRNNSYHHLQSPALLEAVRTTSLPMVQLLIRAGANVNQTDLEHCKRTPLQLAVELAIETSHFEMVQYLLSEGAEVNAKAGAVGGATALQLAAISGHIGIAEELLGRGADPNAKPAITYGRTALEGAAEYGRIDMLKLLFNAGAKIDQQQYESAGKFAVKNGHMATKRYLDELRSEYLLKL